MKHPYSRSALGTLAWSCLFTLLSIAPRSASADAEAAITAVQMLRVGGCGGIFPPAQPLHHDAALDNAAAQWAGGATPTAAARSGGYVAEMLSGMHITGADSSLVQVLRPARCQTLSDHGLHDLGVYRHGREIWLILASRAATPPTASALTVRALQLVNDIRARGARCGDRAFGPTLPLRLSVTLNDVALGHAADMARHGYFEHEDLGGRSPAQRVRAAGYPEKLVGENIAYGPESADEVVQGWLNSPGHCENIMDPRFAEMGIAYSPGLVSRRGLYWVQLLVAPKR